MTTLTLNISLSNHSLAYIKPQDLTDAERLVGHLTFSRVDMTSMGYVNVGTVEIDISLLPPDQIIGNAVVALRAQAANIRAKATAEATALEGKAQQLLAIENGSR
jgi:hypothetical protein